MALTKTPASLIETSLDLTGHTLTVATQSASDNSTAPATTAYVTTALANLVDSAPGTLNTLNELASALGDDANFSTTVTNSIATKLPLAGGTMTGDLTISTAGPSILLTDTDNNPDYQIKNGNGSFRIIDTTNSVDRININTSGNVGIGTTSPATPLEVRTSSDTEIAAIRTGSVSAKLGAFASGESRLTSAGNNGFLTFYTGTSSGERVRIDSSGRVGIGVTNPADYYATNLVVQGASEGGITIASTSTQVWNYLMFADGTSGDARYRCYFGYNHSNDLLSIATAGTERFKIDSSGNIAIANGDLEFSASTGNHTISVADYTGDVYNVGDRGNIEIKASSSPNSGGQAKSGGRVLLTAGNSYNGQSGDIVLSTGVNHLNASDKGKIRFNIGGTASSDEAMRIDSSGNVTHGTSKDNYIDSAGRITSKVQDMINIGGDNWHSMARYYNSFGYGTGGQLSGYSVNLTNGQNASWYAGLTFTGYVTWLPDVYIPYAIGQVYGLSATFFQHANNTAGTAVQYVGCIGYDANFNFMNHDAIGTYQYNLVSSGTFTAGATTEIDVTLKGWQGSGQSDGNKMDRGTVYIRPMMLINYPWSSASGGTTPQTTLMSFTMGPKHTISDNDSNAGTNY